MPAQTPEEVDALFEKYMNAGDIDAVVDLYEPDGVLVQQRGQVAQGRDAIRAALTTIIGMNAQFKLTVNETIVSGDIAVLYNDWSGQFGETELSGKAMEICRRQTDGTWRFVIDDPYARD